ncbi:hypothetical protein E2C01_049971 [Portunus trituberculatus]|uniref:Uncharacterized protein n=1 Tax=Portunus trituberculatus TaxID=210409 RepID=A0A5B7GAU6_PORTR|nr:hypothetical protein [Portunus trituberculatus]
MAREHEASPADPLTPPGRLTPAFGSTGGHAPLSPCLTCSTYYATQYSSTWPVNKLFELLDPRLSLSRTASLPTPGPLLQNKGSVNSPPPRPSSRLNPSPKPAGNARWCIST